MTFSLTLDREKILQKNGKKDSFFRPFPSVIPDAGAHSRKKIREFPLSRILDF
ncbi:hypothetical protein B4135_2536 [Caldibacillus debilis]|uniref:Uncharacterized protein n=1 Tax=Caldibacillus debilis TaxID=301148 RepID=A0A150LYT5_9BACI|nr:hypothetical protein B4135_2536 [Caldibacillus debilis]